MDWPKGRSRLFFLHGKIGSEFRISTIQTSLEPFSHHRHCITVLTISSCAAEAAAISPAPWGAETGRWAEEAEVAPAEVTEAAEGKAAAQGAPRAAAGGDGGTAPAEGTGAAEASK